MVSLAPGDSIKILTRVALPSQDNARGKVIVGRLSLNNDVVGTIQGLTVSKSSELGTAESRDYTLDSLLALH
jgi:hypothetical protein